MKFPGKIKPKSNLVVSEDDLKTSTKTKHRSESKALKVIENELMPRFGKQSGTIMELIEMGDSDGASALIIKALVQSVVEVLPVAEDRVLDTDAKYGIHGYNMIVSQMRELLIDLKSSKDRSMLGQAMVDRTIRPAFQDVAVQIVSAFTLLQDMAKSRMEPADYKDFRKGVEEAKKGLSDYLMAQYTSVSSQVTKSLG